MKQSTALEGHRTGFESATFNRERDRSRSDEAKPGVVKYLDVPKTSESRAISSRQYGNGLAEDEFVRISQKISQKLLADNVVGIYTTCEVCEA
ncbi:MAG: hypothetical protein O3C40_33310 [Planctomycetota bacterium]|nr:hypothetical protein [Planctomycetota bacterium]